MTEPTGPTNDHEPELAADGAPRYPVPSDERAPIVEEQEPATPADVARRAVGVGARVLVGIAGLAVAVLAIGGTTLIPLPTSRATSPAETVTPVAAAQQRVCPGPLLRLGDESGGSATTATSIGAAVTTTQAVPDDPEQTSLPATENLAGIAPELLTLPPVSDTSVTPAVSGSQSQSSSTAGLSGFSAAECAEATGDTWLVGGSTATGRTTIVTLSNPTTVIATVDLAIYGESGRVSAPGAEGLLVAPGTQRIFSLAGYAPGVVSPVVHVESRGGLVVANLQQSVVRTLVTGGIDTIGRTRAPSTETIVSGVVIRSADAVAAAQTAPGFEDLESALRLLAPGDTATTVDVTITSESAASGAVPIEFDVSLEPGTVSDVPLPGLVDGTYTVELEADQPFVAGVRTSTVAEAGTTSDLAWFSGARTLRDETLLSIAPGPSPVLHLTNSSDDDVRVEVEVAGVDVEGRAVEVPQGETVAVAVTADSDVRLTGTRGVRATVTYAGPAQLASFTVTPPGVASSDVTVYP